MAAWPQTQLEHFPNLVTMFLTRAREKGDKPFLWAKRDGAWQSISCAEAARQVAALADSLKRIGLKPGDRVMLVSENRPEWLIADLGDHGRGLRHRADLHHQHRRAITSTSSAIRGAAAVIVSTQKLAQDPDPGGAVRVRNATTSSASTTSAPARRRDVAQFHHWDDLVAGAGRRRRARSSAWQQVGRDDLACIIYTSGTGGAPRGVMQHHGAILAQCRGLHRRHRQRLRLGRRGLPVLPARQPRL